MVNLKNKLNDSVEWGSWWNIFFMGQEDIVIYCNLAHMIPKNWRKKVKLKIVLKWHEDPEVSKFPFAVDGLACLVDFVGKIIVCKLLSLSWFLDFCPPPFLAVVLKCFLFYH